VGGRVGKLGVFSTGTVYCPSRRPSAAVDAPVPHTIRVRVVRSSHASLAACGRRPRCEGLRRRGARSHPPSAADLERGGGGGACAGGAGAQPRGSWDRGPRAHGTPHTISSHESALRWQPWTCAWSGPVHTRRAERRRLTCSGARGGRVRLPLGHEDTQRCRGVVRQRRQRRHRAERISTRDRRPDQDGGTRCGKGGRGIGWTRTGRGRPDQRLIIWLRLPFRADAAGT